MSSVLALATATVGASEIIESVLAREGLEHDSPINMAKAVIAIAHVGRRNLHEDIGTPVAKAQCKCFQPRAAIR
jgi:hypothetical protein